MRTRNVPAAEAKVRGVILANRRTYVIAEFGKEGWGRVLGALPTTTRSVLSGTIRGGEWYPVLLNEQLDRAICAALWNGDPTSYERMGAASAERLLPEAYPFAVNGRDPLAMLRALRQGGARHWDCIVIEHEEAAPTHYRIRFSGFVSNEPNCRSNVGFFARAVELCGGRNVLVEETSCTGAGDEVDCYDIRWDPPLAERRP